MSEPKRISFLAEKKIPKRVKVEFSTRPGKISFIAKKKIPRRVKVNWRCVT